MIFLLTLAPVIFGLTKKISNRKAIEVVKLRYGFFSPAALCALCQVQAVMVLSGQRATRSALLVTAKHKGRVNIRTHAVTIQITGENITT